MSRSQVVWGILWDRAAKGDGPFEIDEVVPEVVCRLSVSENEAKRLVGFLLTELERLPDGEQFFAREGNAAVPLPELADARKGEKSPEETYPFET